MIALGTAQFGMNYGINNKYGKLANKNIFELLDIAYDNNIRNIDTAKTYGDSEKIIGEYIEKNKSKKFNIISKISSKDNTLIYQLKNTLKRLKTNKIQTLLFHSLDVFKYFEREIDSFCLLYKGIYFDELGVSVYTNEEISYLLLEKKIDRIQLPFNLLDNYRYRGSFFALLKKNKIKIDVRSIYLQGLFFMELENFPHYLSPLRKSIEDLQKISKETGISLKKLAFGYVNSFDIIDRIIVGVDSVNQLNDLIVDSKFKLEKNTISTLELIKVENLSLLNPSLWKKF